VNDTDLTQLEEVRFWSDLKLTYNFIHCQLFAESAHGSTNITFFSNF
jgi:hypothetical protein